MHGLLKLRGQGLSGDDDDVADDGDSGDNYVFGGGHDELICILMFVFQVSQERRIQRGGKI